MLKKTEDGSWIDGEEKAVPVRYVPNDDKIRTRLVAKIEKKHAKLIAAMQKSQNEIKADIQDYLTKRNLGTLGDANMDIADFSQDFMIQIFRAKVLKENDNLVVLKKGLNKFMKEHFPGEDDFLLGLINEMFQHKNGKIDPTQVRKAKRYNHKHKNHPDWIKLMDLIDVCFDVVSIKTGIRFYKKDEEGSLKIVPSNLSKM